MKNQAYMMIAAIMLVTVAGLSTANAQTSSSAQMVASIPFEFNVGNKTLPAGEYNVRCINPGSSTKVLQIRSTTGSQSALVRTDSVSGKMKDNAQLLFHRYGNEYFFAQAWMPADSIGMQAPKSRRLKEHELAQATRTSETVALRRSR